MIFYLQFGSNEMNQHIQTPSFAGPRINLSPPPTPGRCHALPNEAHVPEFFLKSQSILEFDCHNFFNDNSQDDIVSLFDRDAPQINIKLRKYVPSSKAKDSKHSQAQRKISMNGIPLPPFSDQEMCCPTGTASNDSEQILCCNSIDHTFFEETEGRKLTKAQEPKIGSKRGNWRRMAAKSA
jgi:hypothetical protein